MPQLASVARDAAQLLITSMNLRGIVHMLEHRGDLVDVLHRVRFQQFEEDLFLAAEVGVESPLAEAGLLGDPIDGGAFVALARHHRACRLQQSCPRQRAAFFPGQTLLSNSPSHLVTDQTGRHSRRPIL